jgi:hypothetical protein
MGGHPKGRSDANAERQTGSERGKRIHDLGGMLASVERQDRGGVMQAVAQARRMR